MVKLHAGYHYGQGPIAGLCSCGGLMKLVWRDKLYAEYVCEKCGLVSNHRGKPRETTTRDVAYTICDRVWNEVGADTGIPLQLFLQVTDKVSLLTLKNHIPVLSKRELSERGFEIIGDTIYKKRSK
jgi:hypothetical protein